MTKKAFVLVGGVDVVMMVVLMTLWVAYGLLWASMGGQWLVIILKDIVLIDIIEEKEKPAYSGHGGDN